MNLGVRPLRRPKSGASPKYVSVFVCFFVSFVGLKKIRNPERMVRIAVGYTGHTPPKSDDTDANSKRHRNTLHTVRACACTLVCGTG